MPKKTYYNIDLREIARNYMIDAGFSPDMPAAVEREVKDLSDDHPIERADSSVLDLRSLLWSSIDNVESRDLDQLEYAERLPQDRIRLMVAIADVDAFVPEGSATSRHAAKNTTSVYTGVTTFPMLPEEL